MQAYDHTRTPGYSRIRARTYGIAPCSVGLLVSLLGMLTTSCAVPVTETATVITEFSANPEQGEAPLPVVFMWAISGSDADCDLNFGDGMRSEFARCQSNATASHTYGTPGTYTATLSLDGAASASLVSVVIEVVQVAPITHTLAVTVTGNNGGEGMVESSPTGIACAESGGTCSASFADNEMVTLTASPGTGSTFDGWQGSGCMGTGTCLVTMDGDKTVMASFSKPAPTTPVRVNTFNDFGLRTDVTAAYREEEDEWEPLMSTATGQYDFQLNAGVSRFSVAIRCGDFGFSWDVTRTEVTEIDAYCPDLDVALANIGLTWQGVEQLGTGSSYGVQLFGPFGFLASGAGAMGGTTVPNLPSAPQDLILAGAVDGAVLGVRIMRDVTPANGQTFNFTFTGSDVGGTALVNPYSVPSPFSVDHIVVLRTPGATAIFGQGDHTGGSYYTAPYLMSGDNYVSVAAANATDGRAISHAMVSSQANNIDFNLPNPWDDFVSPTPAAPLIFTGLNPGQPGHSGYRMNISPLGSSTVGWGAFVSDGWLNLNTNYPTPNPADIPGFEDLAPSSSDQMVFVAESIWWNMALDVVARLRQTLSVPVADGLEQRVQTVTGTYTVP